MTKILVVEDDHQIQQELVLLLQRNGFEAQALTSFESVPPMRIKVSSCNWSSEVTRTNVADEKSGIPFVCARIGLHKNSRITRI